MRGEPRTDLAAEIRFCRNITTRFAGRNIMATQSQDVLENETYSQLEVVIGHLCYFREVEVSLWANCITYVFLSLSLCPVSFWWVCIIASSSTYDLHVAAYGLRLRPTINRNRYDSPESVKLFQHLESTLTKNLSMIAQVCCFLFSHSISIRLTLYLGCGKYERWRFPTAVHRTLEPT